MEANCKFDPWDYINYECSGGKKLRPIKDFYDFYDSKINSVKNKFSGFTK